MTGKNKLITGCLATIGLGLTALSLGQNVPRAAKPPTFGDPLPGVSTNEYELNGFNEGRAAFEHVANVAGGLGPIFNEASCAKCHSAPVSGGASEATVTRFGRYVNGEFDPMIAFGGPLIQAKGIGPFAETNYVGETVPPNATVVTKRLATPLFGLGLVESVPDETFFFISLQQSFVNPQTAGQVSLVTEPVDQLQDTCFQQSFVLRNESNAPNAAIPPGGSTIESIPTGVAAAGSNADIEANVTARIGPPHVWRFGWKCQYATLRSFAADSYLNEIGITSRVFPDENCPQGNCALLVCVPGFVFPCSSYARTDLDRVADFMRGLAPPPRGPMTPLAASGEVIFQKIGCAECHLPTLYTGAGSVVGEMAFHPFSDFLLHDMGALGDGITQNDATGRMMRTAPLWGARVRTRFMHDGRASSLLDAIRAHAGQGTSARVKFNRLKPLDQKRLIAFLNTL